MELRSREQARNIDIAINISQPPCLIITILSSSYTGLSTWLASAPLIYRLRPFGIYYLRLYLTKIQSWFCIFCNLGRSFNLQSRLGTRLSYLISLGEKLTALLQVPLVLVLERQRMADLCRFTAILVYKGSSRPAKGYIVSLCLKRTHQPTRK